MELRTLNRDTGPESGRLQMGEATFRDAVCRRFGIAPERYEREVFLRCVFPAVGWLARLVWRVRPGYFRRDRELIESVAECTSLSEVRAELNRFRSYNRPRGFGRRILHLRVSGQRLIRLAAQVFPR